MSNPIIHFLKSIKQISSKLANEIDDACEILRQEPNLIPKNPKKNYLLALKLFMKDPTLLQKADSKKFIRELEKSLENNPEINRTTKILKK